MGLSPKNGFDQNKWGWLNFSHPHLFWSNPFFGDNL
jgi:hypothetical protein